MATHFSAVDPESVKDIECNICLEPWDDPVELEPCRHVYCRRCTESLRTCPDCRATISNRKQPNRILINLANAAVVRCETCRWQGTREVSHGHRCGTSASSSAAVAAPAQRQQQQTPAPSAPRPQQPAPQANAWTPQPAPRPPVAHSAPWTLYGLDQEEYDHIMAVFMTFDTDGSGELDRREVTTLCRWLNFAHNDADVDRMFRDMDSDGSGSLNMDEFCRWLSTHRPDPQALYGLHPRHYNEVLFQFHTFDRNQDGSLDENEFVGLALRQGYCREEAEARNLFRMIDTDRSSTVDLHELLTFRAHYQARYDGAPPPPQQQTPPQWQQHYPAPAPHGEQLRVPPPGGMQYQRQYGQQMYHQQQQGQMPQPGSWQSAPPPQGNGGYPPPQQYVPLGSGGPPSGMGVPPPPRRDTPGSPPNNPGACVIA
jgi:Ca2+-binding EF-hand superfamily protein